MLTTDGPLVSANFVDGTCTIHDMIKAETVALRGVPLNRMHLTESGDIIAWSFRSITINIIDLYSSP